MKKTFILTAFAILFCAWKATAQEGRTPQLYEGSIDGKLPITLYLVSVARDCGGDPYYQCIYRYNKNKDNAWLSLNVEYNQKNQFILVEYRFSGVMILQKNAEGFSGIWIHPNGTTQKKVVLKKTHLPEADIKKYEDYMDKAFYNTDDC